MDSKRLFIALPVDLATSKEIDKKFSSLNLPWNKLKKIAPEQLHLTLKFLGETNIENVPAIINSLEKVNLKIEDFELTISNSQIFTPKQPKVLSLAISQNNNLQNLYTQIEQNLFDDGLANKEARKFSAHLTLARIKKFAKLEEFEEFSKWQINKSFYVSHFELKESELTKKGPQYTTLQTFKL